MHVVITSFLDRLGRGFVLDLGAYNRLMRLRSAVVQAFGSFDAHMVRGVALLGEFTVAADSASRVVPRGSESQDIAALHGATTQL